MCSSVRVLSAAMAGYLLGGLFGGGVASVVLMVAAGLTMLAWSKMSARRLGQPGCALPPTRLGPSGPRSEPEAAPPGVAPELAAGQSKRSDDQRATG